MCLMEFPMTNTMGNSIIPIPGPEKFPKGSRGSHLRHKKSKCKMSGFWIKNKLNTCHFSNTTNQPVGLKQFHRNLFSKGSPAPGKALEESYWFMVPLKLWDSLQPHTVRDLWCAECQILIYGYSRAGWHFANRSFCKRTVACS